MLRQIGLGLVSAAVMAAPVPASAQVQASFPTRQITLVVPLPAGGTADLLCRIAAERAGAALKQQGVVENRPVGAGVRVAIEAVMRAAPEGHTVLCAPQLSYTVAHLLFVMSPLETRAMVALSVLAGYPLILLGRGNLPAEDFPVFLDYGR